MLSRVARRSVFFAASVMLIAAPSAAQLQYSPQGTRWEQGREDWYTRSQGSRLIPLAWFRALERADSSERFLSPANMERFRYIYPAVGGADLPVGFAADVQDDRGFQFTKHRWLTRPSSREPWVGMNCAACHTGEIAVGTRRLRIDGAPGMGDYQLFNEALVRAMEATRAEPAKFGRFVARIPGADPAALSRAMDEWIGYRRRVEAMNATPLRYGFSRVDAFGHIFNQTTLFANPASSTGNPADAPVSYPFLWNVPQQARLQWNGSVPKKRVGRLDVGAVGRNFGEVVGVYGEIRTQAHRRLRLLLFPNSVNVRNLIWFETQLGSLQSPAWPEEFLRGAGVDPQLAGVDRESARRGKTVFDRERCSTCHQPIGREDLTTPIGARMSYFQTPQPTDRAAEPNTSPGTDPLMACNAAFRTTSSGNLLRYRIEEFADGVQVRRRAGPVEPVINLLQITVEQGLEAHALTLLGGVAGLYSASPRGSAAFPSAGLAAPSFNSADYPASLPEFYRRCVTTVHRGPADGNILGYKARPLNGVWATAPYLHNGSVPTLYDLLLPPDSRPRVFFVGSRDFDPGKVGIRTEPGASNSFSFRARDDANNPVWGNWNGGHDYDNARLTERERWDLVEYLKTL